MRNDVLIREVISKCEVLKETGFWLGEPDIRPKAWLNNFDESDKPIAALLLNNFTFYNDKVINKLLLSAYNSVCDGLPKSRFGIKNSNELLVSLENAYFSPITGEEPNPTDSGLFFCRKARQKLSIPEQLLIEQEKAIEKAYDGSTIVFLDDFVGSGNQFIETWRRSFDNIGSFSDAFVKTNFTAIYIPVIALDIGVTKIANEAPYVNVSPVHIITQKETIYGLDVNKSIRNEINSFLTKYSSRLKPKESYMYNDPDWILNGFKSRGLMLGFEHSVPDLTLPIFWSPRTDTWEPLIERI